MAGTACVQVLREELEWLNYFPAGFKLNVPLTLTLGSGTLVGMDAYASAVGQLARFEVCSFYSRYYIVCM